MKLIYSKWMLALMAVMMFACGGKTEETTDTTDTAEMKKVEEEAKKEREAKGFHLYDRHFQMVTTSYDGVIRGIDMFASIEDVKASESKAKQLMSGETTEQMPLAELVEETDSMLKYKLKMDAKDDAVIIYNFEDGKLNSIKMTVHVLTQAEFSAMEEEFIMFFTHKHGRATKFDDRKEIWKVKGSDVHEIDIIDKHEGEKYFLEIDIS